MQRLFRLITANASSSLFVLAAAGSADAGALLSRYTVTGALDASFNGTGKVTSTAPGIAMDVAIDQSGKVVTCGQASTSMIVARYTATGALDTNFGWAGLTSAAWPSPTAAVACAVQPDGKIVVLNTVSSNPPSWLLVRFTADGWLDGGFGIGGYSSQGFPAASNPLPADIQVDDLGRIVVGATVSGNYFVARYGSNGVLDTNFGWQGTSFADFGGTDVLRGIAVDTGGRVFAIGSSIGSRPGQSSIMGVAAWTSLGQPDMDWGAAGKYPVYISTNTGTAGTALAIDRFGNLLVAGTTSPTSTTSEFFALRLNSWGVLDHSFGNQWHFQTIPFATPVSLYDIAIGTDDKIVFYGSTLVNGLWQLALARLKHDGTLDDTFDGTTHGNGQITTSYAPNHAISSAIALDGNNRPVVVGDHNTP